MSKIQLTKPVLIVMYGFPGSGKSFTARQLAESLGAAYLQADRVRFELFEEPRYDVQESDLIGRLMEYMTEEFLGTGVSVVWDGNADTRLQRKQLKELALKMKSQYLIVWPQIDAQSSLNRVIKRDKRKHDDKYAREYDQTSFDILVNRLQNPAPNEDYVVISGKHNFQTQRNIIQKKLFDLGTVPISSATSTVKPELVNRVPNIMSGRVDQQRRNVIIR